MKKVRILAQYLYFYPRFGGIENHMYYLYKNLAKKGNQITVITSKNMANQPEQENIDGINIIRKGTSGLKNIGKRNYFGWLVDLISSFPILLRKAKKSDILHAHTFFFALPMGIAKRIYKKKLITTLHTVEFLQLAKSFFGRLFLYFFIRNSDLILATSVETKILCEKVINRPIVSIVNGIDTNLFKPVKPAIKKSSKDKVILLCARRLVPKNGIKYLIEAMPLIRKNIDAKLYIIG
ncbi:glycosyltransferase family 4 protein, partial [Candidatus Woesearchaeota archaeon]|nr:glycosyltransferase family 4 protein [Candidatus Woesearchaeota archaeon]